MSPGAQPVVPSHARQGGSFSRAPMPFIVGAPRSGTTLLRLVLDAHPELAIPPETGFVMAADRWLGAADERQAFFDAVTGFPPDAPAWPDFGLDAAAFRSCLDAIEPFTIADGLRAFYRLYADRFGKARVGDKTPTYCFHVRAITALLPEAHIVHIIRDGRDVAASLRRMWFSPGDTMEAQASFWRASVTAAQSARTGDARDRYLEVRYEALVSAPRSTLARICEYLGLPFAETMLEHHLGARARLAEHRDRLRPDGTLAVARATRLAQQAAAMLPIDAARVDGWRAALSAHEQAAFEREAGDLLAELGYR